MTRPISPFAIQVPGSVELPGSGTRIILQVLEKEAADQDNPALCYSGE